MHDKGGLFYFSLGGIPKNLTANVYRQVLE